MTLRTRLIVAFLLMSVVPLAAVTAYSYVSTRNAFRQSAEVKSDLMAEELGRRMEVVTGDIERRVGRIWRMSRPGGVPPEGGPGAQAPNPDEVARTLGNFAALVEKLEWDPRDGVPPGAPGGPRPDVPGLRPPTPGGVLPPGAPRPPKPAGNLPPSAAAAPPPAASRPAGAAGAATSGPSRVIVEVSKSAAPPDPSRFSAEMQAAIIEATDERRREQVTRSSGASPQARAEGGAPPAAGTRQGRDFDFRVVEDGQHVGTVHARMNVERMLRGVLMMTRRDQGEVPFAVDADGQLHTPDEADAARLASLDIASRARAQHTGRSSDGEWVIVTREVPSGVVFGIARPIGGSLAELRRASASNLGLGLAFIALALAGVEAVLADVANELRAFRGTAEPSDDATMMALRLGPHIA